MTVFVDTSALYAVLDQDDRVHGVARTRWEQLLHRNDPLVTSNYILVETSALVQSRLGMEAVRALFVDVLPVLLVEWTTPEDHRAAVAALLSSGKRGLSLVDCSSFEIMRRLGCREAFAFDPDFSDAGFTLVE